MAGQFTQAGLQLIFDVFFRGATAPTGFAVRLVNDTVLITDNWADVSANELPSAGGYTTGGYALNKDATDFPTLVNDGNDVRLDTKEVSWTATADWATAVTAVCLVADMATDQLVAFENISSVQPQNGDTVAWTVKMKLTT
jgi:hypothetical protein